MPSNEKCYQSLLDYLYSSQQKKDAPVALAHPSWNFVLHRMHSLHTHIFHNDVILSRDNRLYNVSVESGA